MGGLARRAALIKDIRAGGSETLLLSAGDFYAKSGIAELYRSRFLSSMMVKMGYDAVAVGEKELGYGLRAIREDADAGLPVICANLYLDGRRLFPPYVIKKVGGSTVGIFALLGEEPSREGEFEIADPLAEGAGVLDDIRPRCDFVILLAHMNKAGLEPVLRALDGVDLVIRGHAEDDAAASSDCADTIGGLFDDLGVPVLHAGSRGKRLGIAEISLDASGRAFLSDTSLVAIRDSMPRDPEMAEMMRRFGAEEGKRVREMSLSEFLSRDTVSGKISERYLGMDVCGRCHHDIVADFMTTPHFRAFNRLTLAGEEANPDCVSCHTTGYGRFSGYSEKSDEKGGMDLRGVQCEACHGQGTTHSRDGKYSSAAKISCRHCHTPAKDPDFILDEMVKRIAHSRGGDPAGEERR
ncbi:MAG: hypothetical protein MUF59_04725 [Candidatus Krumholzibacteria bacterium]|nr:hypothetical protein [Candidatus Krumholzibacteria bacterium]